MTHRIRRPYNLYYVGGDVKPCTVTITTLLTHRLATIHTSQTHRQTQHCSISATVSTVGY